MEEAINKNLLTISYFSRFFSLSLSLREYVQLYINFRALIFWRYLFYLLAVCVCVGELAKTDDDTHTERERENRIVGHATGY